MRRALIPFVVAAGVVSLCLSAEAEWAGIYRFGDGLGHNVRIVISPDRGFAAIWTGCLGDYGGNYGTVEYLNGRLVLDYAQPNEPGTFGGFSRVLIPVPWGERLYLIGEEQLGDFVNAVNSGIEPCSDRCTPFLLRSGDEEVKVTGRPELPAEYAAHLLGEPVSARVVRIITPDLAEVDAYGLRKATVELDVGRSDGIWKGMEFHSSSRALWREAFTVVRVDESTSVAILSAYDSQPLAPKAGTCVSTLVDSVNCPAPQ